MMNKLSYVNSYSSDFKRINMHLNNRNVTKLNALCPVIFTRSQHRRCSAFAVCWFAIFQAIKQHHPPRNQGTIVRCWWYHFAITVGHCCDIILRVVSPGQQSNATLLSSPDQVLQSMEDRNNDNAFIIVLLHCRTQRGNRGSNPQLFSEFFWIVCLQNILSKLWFCTH